MCTAPNYVNISLNYVLILNVKRKNLSKSLDNAQSFSLYIRRYFLFAAEYNIFLECQVEEANFLRIS